MKTIPLDTILWDLSDLFTSHDDPALEKAFEEIISQSHRFQTTYQGTLNGKASPEHFRKALDAYAELRSLEQKPIAYAYLFYVTNTNLEESKILLKKSQSIRSTFRKNTAFFIPEINEIPDEYFHELINAPCLKIYVRFLKKQRVGKQHLLSEKEEAILAKTESTRKKSWTELYLELRANSSGDHLQDLEPAIAQICNALLSDKQTVDELRHFETPLSDFALQNEIPLAVIEIIINTCLNNSDIPEKFMKIKRRVLKCDTLKYADRHKPIFEPIDSIELGEAKNIIFEAFAGFSPQFSKLANQFFQSKWIDPFPRPGKISGGSAEAITPDHHPYIFTNFMDKPVDVAILAHELGHGIHYLLAKNNHFFDFQVNPIMAETVSIFAEMILFHHVTQEKSNLEHYAMWLSRRLDDIHARIFDCLTGFLFEKRIHEAAKSGSTLKTEDFRQYRSKALNDVWAKAFPLVQHQAYQWIHYRGMFTNPFYSFTYVFGELIAQSLYVKWQEEGTRFVDQYISLLKAGGSVSPEELLNFVDLSIHDPKTWENGISAIKMHIEKLSEAITVMQKQ